MARQLKRSGNQKRRVIKRRSNAPRRESARSEYYEDIDVELKHLVHQWRGVKRQLGYLNKQEETLKDKLKKQLHSSGYADSDGHLHIDFDEPVDGLAGLLLQKRSSKPLDEEVAEDILKEHKLLKECKKEVTQEVFDEDAILAAHFKEELTDEEMEEMFPENVTWALYGVDDK